MQQIVPVMVIDPVAARYQPDELVLASPGRRLGAAIIDLLIAWGPLLLAWVIWLASPDAGGLLLALFLVFVLGIAGGVFGLVCMFAGQSPGKRMLSMYVLKGDGTRAGFGWMFLREFVVKFFLGPLLNVFTGGIYGLLAAMWCLWDDKNQCLWDKISGTYVGYSPYGFVPMTDKELLLSGGAAPQLQFAGGGAGRGYGQVVEGTARPAMGTMMLASGYGRIGVIDRGRPLADVSASDGRALLIGRDPGAAVVLTDPKVSRRHAEVWLEGSTWVVRDLGAMNQTRIVAAGSPPQNLGSGTRRLQSGQIALGDSIITLYPAGS